jgi:peroxiredoxin Q/BCP
MATLEIGDKAPSFTVLDQDGKKVKLTDYKGQKVILYFYPAASSPGCTKEAWDFNDSLAAFKAAGYAVLGISPDGVDKIKKFHSHQKLKFTLLSDESLEVHKAYGAYGLKKLYGREYQGVIRSTFVIDEKGKIEMPLYSVKATGHVTSLLKKLELAN